MGFLAQPYDECIMHTLICIESMQVSPMTKFLNLCRGNQKQFPQSIWEIKLEELYYDLLSEKE